MHLLSATRYNSWHRCQRHHHYRYERRYVSRQDSPALRFGTWFHEALETWWLCHETGNGNAALPEAREALRHSVPGDIDPFIYAQLDVLLVGYDLRWGPEMAGVEVLHVEKEFRAPLFLPDGWCIGGKLDAVIRRRSGGVWIVEHKTSGSDLDPGSSYWVRLRLDPQVSIYHDGGRVLGYQIEGCIYDVVRKPGIRPLKATPVESRKYRKDGALYKNQRADDETVQEYTDRLCADVSSRPEHYFLRAEVVRLDRELEEARRDLLYTALAIQAGRGEYAPRNPGSCFAFGSACEYFDVCSGAASLENNPNLVRLKTAHRELSEQGETK